MGILETIDNALDDWEDCSSFGVGQSGERDGCP